MVRVAFVASEIRLAHARRELIGILLLVSLVVRLVGPRSLRGGCLSMLHLLRLGPILLIHIVLVVDNQDCLVIHALDLRLFWLLWLLASPAIL